MVGLYAWIETLVCSRRKGGVSNMSALCHLVEELRELGHIVEITCIDGNEMRNGKSTIPYN